MVCRLPWSRHRPHSQWASARAPPPPVVPIQYAIAAHGYQSAFLWFGLGQGIIILIVSQALQAPSASMKPPAAGAQSADRRSHAPIKVLKTPMFWLLYVMFTLVAAGGLIVTAQFALNRGGLWRRQELYQPDRHCGHGTDRGAEGGQCAGTAWRAALFFGWISDKIGWEETMFIAFMLAAAAIWSLSTYGHDPLMFVVTAGAIYFTWGEIYSLFPATCTDSYGFKYATTNAGMLYTAKGTASLLVPYSAYLAAKGDWHTVFGWAPSQISSWRWLAVLVLRPVRKAHRAANPLRIRRFGAFAMDFHSASQTFSARRA